MHVFGKTAIGVIALGAVIGLTACSTGAKQAATPVQLAASNDSGDRAAIKVNGHGKVEGTPDVMSITMGVETRDASAQAALRRNSERAKAMIDALKAQGVQAKDIQTQDIAVDANYDKDNKVTGYTARNTITAKLRDINKAGQVIDAAAETAGDDIRLQGVVFSIDDTSALVAEARAKAVKDAQAQAKQLADAGGIKVGTIHSIDSTSSSYQPQFYDSFRGATLAAEAIPLERGTQQLTVDVTVQFDISG
jgi:uncharacterized protein YggE